MIVALDIGTSSSRARIYDERGVPVEGRGHQEQYEPTTTAGGGVEHDPERLLRAVGTCLDGALAGGRRPEILGVAVTSFWHGLLGFDAAGRPATPIYTWADTRAARDADLLRHALDEDRVHARTGCHLHACYWPAKLRWLAHDQPATLRRVTHWGSIGEHLEQISSARPAPASPWRRPRDRPADARLGRRNAGGRRSTSASSFPDRGAGRRGLRAQWARRWPALAGATWFPALGDGASSTVGSDCLDPTRIALNVGTSAALRFVAEEPVAAPRGLWSYRVDRYRTVVGGATSEGGNVYAWLRSVLHLPGDDEVETALTRTEPDTHGLTVPSPRRRALAGLAQ